LSDAAVSTKVNEPLASDDGFDVPRHVAIIMDGNGAGRPRAGCLALRVIAVA